MKEGAVRAPSGVIALVHDLSAVHIDGLAADEVSRRSAQEQSEPCDLIRPASAAEGTVARDVFLPFLSPAVVVHARSIDGPRTYAVDVDVVRAQFPGERLCEAYNGELGGDVGGSIRSCAFARKG